MCAIGSFYSGKIQGYAPVSLTGLLVDNIKQKDSGVYVLDNALVRMNISGYNSGDLIKLNNKSGRILSNSGSGFLSDKITGSGCFTTGITDWFYNPSNNSVAFYQNFTGCFNGSGKINVAYTRIKPNYVNQLLAFGGFFNQIFNVNITTGVQFTGLMNIPALRSGITGIYNYTGQITGYANSGYLNVSSGINIDVTSLNIMSDYVQGGITGYKNASAYLNYNSPSSYDYIIINGKTISYSADTTNYVDPDYYASSGDILSIVNSDPSTFGVSGFVDFGKIKFVSLSSGLAGNSINISAGRGNNTGNNYPAFESNSLTGGLNLYRQIKATGLYTGNFNVTYISTGFYNVNNSTGIITGLINSYQGVRDFTGIWNITTGNFFTGYQNFQKNNWISGFSYTNTVGGSSYCLSPSIFDVAIIYSDLFSTNANADVAKISISGINTNSGLSYYITGINTSY